MSFTYYLHVLLILVLEQNFINNLDDPFKFVRPISGNIASVTDFLAFIALDINVSFIVAINKLRLSNSLTAII